MELNQRGYLVEQMFHYYITKHHILKDIKSDTPLKLFFFNNSRILLLN